MTRAILLKFCVLFSLQISAQPSPKCEFRGVWIASVMNIDWPTKAGLTSDEQKKEFIQILDMHKSNGMNAVVVQIRPAADAFYPSRYEPWSKWLTGKLGLHPQPYYDPLKFMIEESHKRGLEFHAWFNPYRGVVGVDMANIDSASVAFQHPKWFLKYDKNLYFDPGLPEARQHTTNVVLEVVNKYDVDGIHFDDYFYPYKVPQLDFPDSASFKKYGKDFTNIEDWRRNNVDMLIKNISDSIRSIKPFVKFGISPFGVWRNQDKDPNGSATKAGQTCYDDLYADILKWLREGWIDYVTPQIYWTIGFERADYKAIADWWNKNNHNIPVYVGQAAYRINSNNSDSTWKQSSQVPRQIRLNRSLANVRGSIFFSSKSFIPNPLGINDSLKNNFYKNPALIPSTKGTSFTTQYEITFSNDRNGIRLVWQEQNSPGDLSPHARYVIYRFAAGDRIDLSDPSKILKIVPDTNPHVTTTQSYVDTTAKRKKKYVYVVTGINRYQTESKATAAYPIKNLKKYWRTYPPILI
jgi:uncharacterized lipoprotein YddW (UPF0748 family)